MNKIGIACDHAGYDLKELLAGYLAAKGFEVFDFGCAGHLGNVSPIASNHAISALIGCGVG